MYNIVYMEGVFRVDIQLKKGILDICILRYLKEQNSYGYKIIEDVSKYIEISESTLYPILKRLEEARCLETYQEIHNGRNRKYYKITDEGKDFLKEELDTLKLVLEN